MVLPDSTVSSESEPIVGLLYLYPVELLTMTALRQLQDFRQ